MSELKDVVVIICLIIVIGLMIAGGVGYFYFRSVEKRTAEVSRILQLPLEEQYELGPKRNFDFSEFERATKIKLYHRVDSSFQREIDDAEKVDLAKRYIQAHSDNWAQVPGDNLKQSFAPCKIDLRFYDNGNSSGSYIIAGDRVLIYEDYKDFSGSYWRLVDKAELKALAKALDIPENLLYKVWDTECFPNG